MVYMQDRGFNSFASNVIKLSVDETKWSSFPGRTLALLLYISIGIFDFGPEFRETGHSFLIFILSALLDPIQLPSNFELSTNTF